jgi:hypothetical protein
MFAAVACMILLGSCRDYLNVVPNDIPTMDHAFSNRTTAEKFLFTCYSYLPNPAEVFNNSGPAQSRESWYHPADGQVWFWINSDNSGNNLYSWRIAKGEQNTNSPLLNYWDGNNGGKPLFTAIRDCNIFLENIDRPTGLFAGERERWTAEVKFLKAYYHFMLLRQYGPIPIIRTNLDIAASPEEVRVFRDPVDEVADYIVELLDEAAEVLPPVLTNATEELGRATKTIVLAVKAQVLTLMASKLFNDNPYVSNFTDSRGTALFPAPDPSKWARAATAIKAAIDCAELEAGCRLFKFEEGLVVSDAVKQEMSIRGAVTERWNPEIIWGSVKSDSHLQLLGFQRFETNEALHALGLACMGATLSACELFYTKNGLPINEDREYMQTYPDIYATSTATAEYADYIRTNFTTANLNFDREPRYYATITFDGGYFFGNNNQLKSIGMKANDPAKGTGERGAWTGIGVKKVVNRETVLTTSSWTPKWYSYPFIRLADLYLLYAEALNESKPAPDDEVFEYIDAVRERAGLKGVRETWTSAASLHPEYVTDKSRMRDIIHRERLIELAFENQPYWDVIRWMEGEDRWNYKPVQGWNVYGTTAPTFYVMTTVGDSRFTYRDYFSPISQTAIDRNPNLKQNPGW